VRAVPAGPPPPAPAPGPPPGRRARRPPRPAPSPPRADDDEDGEQEHNPLSRAGKRKARAAEAFAALQEARARKRPGGVLGGLYCGGLTTAAPARRRAPSDATWQVPLGMRPKAAGVAIDAAAVGACAPQQQAAGWAAAASAARSGKACAASEEAAGAARAAPGLVKDALSVTRHLEAHKVVVREERKFAGETVVVEKKVDAGSKEAARAEKKAAELTRLQRLVKSLKKGNKVSIVDKTKADWDKWKHRQGGAVQEELEAYKKSSNKYLDRQDFLKRAELREFEKQRDARLGYMSKRG